MNSFAQIILRTVALVVMAALVLMAGCQKKSTPDVLARVGEQTITVDDFKAEVERRVRNRQSIPPREKLLEEMIVRATLVQRARAAGLESSADVRRIFEDVLIAKLKEAEIEPLLAEVKISPEEIRTAYEKDIARFTQPGKAQLAMIYLAASPKTETNRLAEIAKRAHEARRLALSLSATNRNFGSVAANFSEDQVSRYRGGDAGWFTAESLANRWPKEVVAVGLKLKGNGEVSDVIRAEDGFYLVKKMDFRAPVVVPLADAQAGIERRLITAKQGRVEDEFRQALRVAAKVQTDLSLLSRVDFPTQSVASAADSMPPLLPASP